MSSETYKLLKGIAAAEEIFVKDLGSLVGKKYGDHRDYYPLARLFTAGYVDVTLKSYDGDGFAKTNQVPFAQTQSDLDIAMWAYMSVEIPEGEQYLGQTLSGTIAEERIFATAAGTLMLDEMIQKREDRAWALGIGIAIAVIAALATNQLSSYLT